MLQTLIDRLQAFIDRLQALIDSQITSIDKQIISFDRQIIDKVELNRQDRKIVPGTLPTEVGRQITSIDR